jgi:predicted transcriptional regulator
MASLKRVFTLRMQDEVFDKLEELAKKEHRSMTNMIEFILMDYLKGHEQENGEIERGKE